MAKEVDGVAKARIEAAGNELAGLRSDGERIAELEAGNSDEKNAEDQEDDADEAQRRHGMRPGNVDEVGKSGGDNDGEEKELAVHGGMIAKKSREKLAVSGVGEEIEAVAGMKRTNLPVESIRRPRGGWWARRQTGKEGSGKAGEKSVGESKRDLVF